VAPASFALGADARFVARSVDTQRDHLCNVLKRAHAHRGTSFVEIFQNCIVYNDEVFAGFTEKDVADDAQIRVEHGKPLIFGKERNRGLRLAPGRIAFEVATLGDGGVGEGDILVHDENNRVLASMLAELMPPAFPMALGVLYCDPAESFEAVVAAQIERAEADAPDADVNALLRQGHTWQVRS
jgi:2-oxoglutarate ferredoxin oxidoreductase subunit beta